MNCERERTEERTEGEGRERGRALLPLSPILQWNKEGERTEQKNNGRKEERKDVDCYAKLSPVSSN